MKQREQDYCISGSGSWTEYIAGCYRKVSRIKEAKWPNLGTPPIIRAATLGIEGGFENISSWKC